MSAPDLTARDGGQKSAAKPIRETLLSDRFSAVGLCKRRIWKVLRKMCLPKADTDEVQCNKRQLGVKTLDKANDQSFVPFVAHGMIGIAHSSPNVGKKACPRNNSRLPCSHHSQSPIFRALPPINIGPGSSRTAYPCSISIIWPQDLAVCT
jgi:hypothetical protein